jgi:hypothetical protein
MKRSNPRTDTENQLPLEIIKEGLTPRNIFESEKLPDRTYEVIKEPLNLSVIVATKQTAIVETIKPVPDALSMEEVAKLFSTAFKQICKLQQVGKLMFEHCRIIFQAAKDYLPLFRI